jgi:hypothetical protein
MAGQDHDFPEHFEAGFQPHAVLERYHMCARPGQPFNRVVDISSQIDRKIEAIAQCKSQGGGNGGSLLRARLERERKRLADLAYAERFYYMDLRQPSGSKVDEYVEKHAVRL